MAKQRTLSSKDHFSIIAKNYDLYKKRNWYYYSTLKKALIRSFPNSDRKKILEIGCGTGDQIANKKHKNKNLNFIVSSAESLNIKEKFDYIFLIDVLEHLTNFDRAIKN